MEAGSMTSNVGRGSGSGSIGRLPADSERASAKHVAAEEGGIVLFCDWDETITAHDTLALIAPPDGVHPGPPFASYGKAYMDDMAEHDRRWADDRAKHAQAATTESRPSSQVVRLSVQQAYLASFDIVELASQQRIEQGALFKGCDMEAIEARARQHVQWRDGWAEFAQQWLVGSAPSSSSSSVAARPNGAHRRRIKAHIISVGWSARFIAAGLRDSCTPASICANEVDVDAATGRGTGKLTKSRDAVAAAAAGSAAAVSPAVAPAEVGRCGIRVAQHKVREMRRILAALPHARQNPLVVYAGDSPTDLEALLEADVGLVLGGKESLRKVLVDEIGMDSGRGGNKTKSSDGHRIGRLFDSFDAARPSVHALAAHPPSRLSVTASEDANSATIDAAVPSDEHETSKKSPPLPRAAAAHRALLIRVGDWHEAGKVFAVLAGEA